MNERRSEPRIELAEPLAAKVKASVPARVMDLSVNGVQLEIAQSLRPNVSCELRVKLDGSEIGVRALVRRCRAIGFGFNELQQRVLLYRAGLEFQDVSVEIQERLVTALEQVAMTQTGGQQNPGRPADGAQGNGVVPEQAASSDLEDQLGQKEAVGRRVPRPGGPVKIRISAEHIRKILGKDS
jgi:hypothetical protein